jgi:pyruvate dehydrogenase E1 component alpha subunit
VDSILSGEIRCPVHLYSGEEAIAAGICAALKKEDYLFGTHRSHGHYLAKGGDLRELVAEVYCKETGCSKGRGGSMHILAPEFGMMGAAPVVGGTISLALGASLASRIRQDGRVTISVFGDGATGEGVLFEAMNFAALRCLPILFVCENNFYSTHLSIQECRPKVPIYKLGQAFGIPSFRVDGNKVLKVFETAKKAIAFCRKNQGPAFIEYQTYRLRGHVGPDDNIQGNHTDIRPLAELTKWKKKDPIRNFARHLLKNGVATDGELEGIRQEAEAEVKSAHSFARASLYPKEDQLGRYVFK